MRQSHVELRSRRYAPRQYVALSHWHKPDAPTHRQPAPAECAVSQPDEAQPE